MWSELDSGGTQSPEETSGGQDPAQPAPSTEVTGEQVRRSVETRISGLRSRLTSTKSSKGRSLEELATTRKGYNAEGTGLAAAQVAANAMAQSYARPNMLMQHIRVSKEEENNNGNDFLRQRSASLTARKPTYNFERRHSDQDRPYLTSQGSSGQLIDLVNDKLEEVAMSPEDVRYNTQLLSEARHASDRFRNRRGRQWSIDSSLSSNGDRSPGHSGGSSPRDRSPATDRRRSSSDTSTSSISQNNGSDEAIGDVKTSPLELHHQSSPENLDTLERESISERMEHVEERIGAEGESDTEDNKSPRCRPRSDSDLDDIDIKADILKNIAPLQAEQNKSKEPMAKRREEQKLKRNVSFKMPQLSEAQEVNGAKETDTTDIAMHSVTQDSTIISAQQRDEYMETPSPAFRRQDEAEVDAPPKLLPNSVLKALGLAPKETKDVRSMNAQEIEDKYNALASALKLDQHTLDKRMELLQHQRDQSESSIERELAAIQQCLVTLRSQCTDDSTSNEFIATLQKQADDLQNMSIWLAGRAERLGAVKEEGRLSNAAEIMVLHVENLRRMFETEHAELEEARKLLQENRAFLRGNISPGSFSLDDQDSRLFNRRAFSISPGSKMGNLKRKMGTFDYSGIERHEELTNRRRASVAVFSGSQLATSSPQEGKSKWNLINKARLGSSLSMQDTSDGAPGQTNSTDGDKSPASPVSPTSPTTHLPGLPGQTPRNDAIKTTTDDSNISKPLSPSHKTIEEKSGDTKSKKEDDLYQQGYEQGVRAKVSEELGELRGQQKEFCENLEQLMENAAEEEEQDEKEQQEQESNAQRHFLRWPALHNIHQRKLLRLGFVAFLFITVLVSVLIQNLPENLCGPGNGYRDGPMYRLCEIILPFTSLSHRARQPL